VRIALLQAWLRVSEKKVEKKTDVSCWLEPRHANPKWVIHDQSNDNTRSSTCKQADVLVYTGYDCGRRVNILTMLMSVSLRIETRCRTILRESYHKTSSPIFHYTHHETQHGQRLLLPSTWRSGKSYLSAVNSMWRLCSITSPD